ncbi:zinc finger CCCH domain-containing protein 19, partial [Tanacetum coccineum]
PHNIAPLTSDEIDSDKRWSYRDPNGNIHGLFSLAQLRSWKDYFPSDLQIWSYYGNVKEAILLHNALSRQTKDAVFRVSGLLGSLEYFSLCSLGGEVLEVSILLLPIPVHYNLKLSIPIVLGRKRSQFLNYMDWLAELRFTLRYTGHKEYSYRMSNSTIKIESTQEEIEASKAYDDCSRTLSSCIIGTSFHES